MPEHNACLVNEKLYEAFSSTTRLSYIRATAFQLVAKDPNTWQSERNGDLEPPIAAKVALPADSKPLHIWHVKR